ncbi:MAG: DNA adenine methylase [Casimicrobium sp.]
MQPETLTDGGLIEDGRYKSRTNFPAHNAPTRPALRYHGAKFRLAPWVMQFFPPHKRYTEVFGGAAGVLLQKPRVYSEIYNDLDGDVVNFFAVLRDPALRARLVEALALTPYARDEWANAYEETADEVERARRLCVRAYMGFGSAGATKGSGGFRCDSKRQYATVMHSWANYPGAVQAAGERFEGVLIENRPAVSVLLQHDCAETLHFVDPPYVHSERVLTGAQGYYRHEMTDAQHVELLDCLRRLKGMVAISGYPSALYSEALKDWRTETTQARISAHRGTGIRTECVWLNPACAAALAPKADLFSEAA